jgi:hypothetical protein
VAAAAFKKIKKNQSKAHKKNSVINFFFFLPFQIYIYILRAEKMTGSKFDLILPPSLLHPTWATAPRQVHISTLKHPRDGGMHRQAWESIENGK